MLPPADTLNSSVLTGWSWRVFGLQPSCHRLRSPRYVSRSGTVIITNRSDSGLTDTHGQKMNANGMLPLFTELGWSPGVISQWRVCLVHNTCAMFNMPLLIFPRCTLTSGPKDNWQFMTPLHKPMQIISQSGGGQSHSMVWVLICAHSEHQHMISFS